MRWVAKVIRDCFVSTRFAICQENLHLPLCQSGATLKQIVISPHAFSCPSCILFFLLEVPTYSLWFYPCSAWPLYIFWLFIGLRHSIDWNALNACQLLTAGYSIFVPVTFDSRKPIANQGQERVNLVVILCLLLVSKVNWYPYANCQSAQVKWQLSLWQNDRCFLLSRVRLNFAKYKPCIFAIERADF